MEPIEELKDKCEKAKDDRLAAEKELANLDMSLRVVIDEGQAKSILPIKEQINQALVAVIEKAKTNELLFQNWVEPKTQASLQVIKDCQQAVMDTNISRGQVTAEAEKMVAEAHKEVERAQQQLRDSQDAYHLMVEKDAAERASIKAVISAITARLVA